MEFLRSHKEPATPSHPRAVIYARYSSDMQDTTSIDVQLDADCFVEIERLGQIF